MKITCTQEEKEQLILIMAVAIQCPFAETRGHYCDGTMNCRPCLEQGIEWEIVNDPG